MMKKIAKSERICLSLLVLADVLALFIPAMKYPLAILACLALILGFHHLGRAFQWATGIFFLLGLVLLTANHFSCLKLTTGVNSMTGLIVLLIIMQLFTVPIKIGGYQASIINLVNNKLPTNKKLFVFTMLITFLLSSILSMGTVPIVYSVLGPTLQKRLGSNYHHFSSVAISRAFTLGTLWAPGAATIFLISSITKVPLQKLFLPSFSLGVLGLLLAYLVARRQPFLTGSTVKAKKASTSSRKDLGKVLQILLAILILLAIAFTLISLHVGETMSDVALAGLIVVLAWTGLLQHNSKAHQQTEKAFQDYYHTGIINGGSLAPFFVAIGLFSSAFEYSSLSAAVAKGISPGMTALSWGALVLIPILVVLLSLIGIHPLASVTLLGQIMVGIHLPFSILAVALALNIGSVLAYMGSPFAGIVVVLANIIHEKTTTVALKWNGKYCCWLLVLSLIFIFVYTRYLIPDIYKINFLFKSVLNLQRSTSRLFVLSKFVQKASKKAIF